VDYRQDYALESPEGGMTVTGHVEQMRLSKCYRESDTLSCTTCHSPHDEPEPKGKVAYYRAACLGCHAAQGCKVDPARLKRESPENSCVACHMPSSPTDIPHLAFTHHRIGLPGAEKARPAGEERGAARLRPFLDQSRLTEIDRERSLGIGYLEAAGRDKAAGRSAGHMEQALGLLSAVREAGLRDSAVEVSLARIHSARGHTGETISLARDAVALGDWRGRTAVLP
jgi:predicted CXXCH cytochrome family protein